MNEEEYYDYLDKREGSAKVININPVIIIVLLIIATILIYVLQSSQAELNTYILYGAVLVLVIVVLNKKGEEVEIKYISKDTAQQIVKKELDYLKSIEKTNDTGYPKGPYFMGKPQFMPHPIEPHKFLYWLVGFSIRDIEDDNNYKHFLAKVDPIMGGVGIMGVENIETEFDGKAPEKFKEPIPVIAEKYYEYKSGKSKMDLNI